MAYVIVHLYLLNVSLPADRRQFACAINYRHRETQLSLLQEIGKRQYGVTFLVSALVAAFLGFGDIAADTTGIANILCFIFVAIAIIGFIFMCTHRSQRQTAFRGVGYLLTIILRRSFSESFGSLKFTFDGVKSGRARP